MTWQVKLLNELHYNNTISNYGFHKGLLQLSNNPVSTLINAKIILLD